MRAMDYISSTDICYLVCDALSLMGKEPVEHGMRIAYMLMKLLQIGRASGRERVLRLV